MIVWNAMSIDYEMYHWCEETSLALFCEIVTDAGYFSLVFDELL